MATNTLNGVNLTKISQISLDVLATEGVPLSAFTTDFSGDALPKGETITTRFATVPTTQDFDSSKATSNSATTARSVTLDDYRGVSIGFKDTEITYSPVQLADLFVRPAISSLVDYVINKVLTQVTNANGFTDVATVAAASFDADAVADLAEGLSTRKVPKGNRTLLLKPTYMANLAKDNTITAASDGPAGVDPIREHRLPRLHGFGVQEYNGTIPANAENMEGIACGQQGLICAARQIVEPPSGTWYGNVENIVEPNSGIPLQVREYYDGTELRYEFSILFGVAKGIEDYVTRIASA